MFLKLASRSIPSCGHLLLQSPAFKVLKASKQSPFGSPNEHVQLKLTPHPTSVSPFTFINNLSPMCHVCHLSTQKLSLVLPGQIPFPTFPCPRPFSLVPYLLYHFILAHTCKAICCCFRVWQLEEFLLYNHLTRWRV